MLAMEAREGPITQVFEGMTATDHQPSIAGDVAGPSPNTQWSFLRISSSTTLLFGNSDRYRGVFLAMKVPQIQLIDRVEDTPVWQERQVPWRYLLVEVPQFLRGLHSFSSAQSSRLLTGAGTLKTKARFSSGRRPPFIHLVFLTSGHSDSSGRNTVWNRDRLCQLAGLESRQ